MTPEPLVPLGTEPVSEGPSSGPGHPWYHKLGAVLFANFCFLVGIVLIAFPWLTWWDGNYFSDLSPEWRQLWLNPFFRGAVSGVGLLNVFISVVEIFGLRRFSD